MSVLRAHLILLGERLGFCLWCASAFIMLIACVLFAWRDKADVLFPLLAIVVFPISQIVAAAEVEILSCSFALVLPGHQDAIRQFVFRVGLVISLAVTLIVLPESLAAGHAILRLWLTFSASLTVYFIVVGLPYVSALPGFTITMYAVILALWGLEWFIDATVIHIPLGVPVSAILTGPLSASVVWWCLGRPPWRLPAGILKRGGLSWRPNRDRVSDQRYADSASTGLILSRIRGSGCLCSSQYIWGTLYAWLTPGGGWRRQLVWTFSYALACAGLSWFVPSAGHMIIAFKSFDAFFDRSLQLPLHSKLLIAGGRRERFLATLVRLIILGVVWMASVALSFTALNFLLPYLPKTLAWTMDLKRGIPPVDIALAMLLTAFYPIFRLMSPILADVSSRYAVRISASMVLLLSVVLSFALAQHWLPSVPPVCVPFVIAASWAVCTYGLYRVAMRMDLVSGRPEKLDYSWLDIRRRIRDLRE